ncbi:hypothetical protein MYX76_09445 [Desulfobacterota bacterium AH_259_B03_O07]|nr:hypothetical protein [Desulfobacterota bacterium AH_259_B03_O07]
MKNSKRIKVLAQEGETIYQSRLKKKLEVKHRGEIIAIDVDSGKYFMGKTVLEAVEKGRQKYPNKLFHVIRVGYPAVHSIR